MLAVPLRPARRSWSLYAFNKEHRRDVAALVVHDEVVQRRWHNPDLRQALVNSFMVALLATLIALSLGTLAPFAVHR